MIQLQMCDSMLQKHCIKSIRFLIPGRSDRRRHTNGSELFRFSVLATHVRPCLEKLNQDSDHDVQHFAHEALESKFHHTH